MDSTIITASAAAVGSLVGAAASIVTTWITQRTQTVRAKMEEKLRERESLYGESITEASRLTVEALTHSLENPEPLVYGRIRLVAADPVLAAGEACVRQIVDLYSKPNMTIEQIRVAFERDRFDPIKDFSTACRAELLEISSTSYARA
jgi:transcription-repair coupling factor (superfamily II helicase)